MPQFFVDKSMKPGGLIEITGPDAAHISQSLRLVSGDWIILSDGAGRSFKGVIETSSAKLVRVKIESETTRPVMAPPPALALALIKQDRFEWALEKAVEIGCTTIIPFKSKRTVVKIDGNTAEKRVARWSKIAREAAKQSGLPFTPEVRPVTGFSELFNGQNDFDRTILFYEGEKTRDLSSVFRENMADKKSKDLIIIGPEGGFAAEEVELAIKSGATTLSLGPQILRVETAAIAAMAIWQYEAGNLDIIKD